MDLQTEQLIARGRQAIERREYAAALADFREVLASHPEFADVRQLAGVCLSFLGQPEAALEEFDRALALNDGYIEAHLNRALTLNELGRFDEAREAFERAWQAEHDELASSILITTHIMEEAEELCDRVAIMHQGKLIALGTPNELMTNAGVSTLDEAFVHYTGQTIEVGGSFKDIQRERQTARRLG